MDLSTAYNSPEYHRYFELFSQGEQRGLSYLQHQLSAKLSRSARKIITDDFEIDTIIQDAFMSAWVHRAGINDFWHLHNYLMQGIKWACFAWIRNNKNRRTISIEWSRYKFVDPYDDEQEAESPNGKQLMADLLEQAISCLSPQKKRVMILWKDGLSYNDIAKAEHTSPQHVATVFKNSLSDLRMIQDRLARAAQTEAMRPKLLLADYKVYLDEQQSEIFRLFYEETHSLQQIAEQLHTTLFQVQKQYARIKRIIDNKPTII